LPPTFRYCCRCGIHCSSCPEPLFNNDKKVKVNKQKPSNACPARLKLIANKILIVTTSSRTCSNTLVGCSASICQLLCSETKRTSPFDFVILNVKLPFSLFIKFPTEIFPFSQGCPIYFGWYWKVSLVFWSVYANE